jgi:phage gp36-like protein
MFAARADLLARTNAMRLAQLAVPADHEFPRFEKALRDAIEGREMEGYSEEEQAALALALEAIDHALADADALLVSYGIPPDVQTTLLARLSSTVALYYLQGAERMTEDVLDAYEAVLKLLDKYQRGTLPGLVPEGAGAEIAHGLAEIQSGARRYPPRFPAEGDE